jgi:hypothetical protein
MYIQKVMSKKLFKKLVFCWHLWKVNDENITIRIQIRIHKSEAWIRGSGSTPKCYGSATLELEHSCTCTKTPSGSDSVNALACCSCRRTV